MTRLNYSGRSAASSWKQQARPTNSKKWVRAVDDRTMQETIANQPTLPSGTNWGTYSWKRSENSAASGTVKLDVPQPKTAPHSLPFKESERNPFQSAKTDQSSALDKAKEDATTAENANKERIPYKVSRNKLILQHNEAPRDDKGNYIKPQKNNLRLVRGETKPQIVDDGPIKTTFIQNPDNSAVCKYSRTAPQFTKKRKRPSPPKRIHIDSSATNNALEGPDEKVHASSEGDEGAEKNDESTRKEGKNAKMLTDFAYRETKFRTRSGINQGLVRVHQDSAKICPTFLKGVECTNVRCMKRHDVPAELAMPVCSFFQRKGMCLKEDCKFRHVKVSVSASNCPNFERKGYCDDASCKLLHRSRKRAPVSQERR